MCPLGLSFFGQTSEHRLGLFKQIHEIVFHGGGGYTWFDVYNMPVWLRRYTFNELQRHHDKYKEKYLDKQQPQQPQLQIPNEVKQFVTKKSPS